MAIFGKTKSEPKDDSAKNINGEVAKATKVKGSKKAPSVKTEKQAFHVRKRKGRRQTARQNMAKELSRVLLRPRITEKATDVTANGTYVFEISVNATKRDVAKAVEHYYKVVPAKVNMVKIPSKKRRNRNRRTFGQSSVGKKAYVYLKKGDSIEFV